MPAKPWQSGKTITTPSGRTAPSATCHLPSTPNSAIPRSNGTGRLSCHGAPRPVPLHHRAKAAQMTFGLCFQLDERRGSGQETPSRLCREPADPQADRRGLRLDETVGGMRRPMLRGTDRLGSAFTFAAAAYNLVRLPKHACRMRPASGRSRASLRRARGTNAQNSSEPRQPTQIRPSSTAC